MDRTSIRRTAAAIMLSALAAIPAAAEDAQPLPRAVAVVDASSSMWSKIGGADRLRVLKAGLAGVLPDYAGRVELGLIAFGHRKKSSCSDIAELAAPAPLDAAAAISALDGLKPRGRSPLADAMRQAADRLAGPGGRVDGRMLLLVDGADNCKQDACAVAAELAGAHQGLAIHVLGIAPSEEDAEQLRCVARTGRGEAVLAGSREEIEAGLARLLDLVSLPPVLPEEVSGPPALRLAARLGTGGPELAEGLSWRVARLDDGGASGEEVYSGSEPAPRIELAPGKYLVEATAGPATASQTFEIKEVGTTKAELALEAGILSMRALGNDGTTELQGVYFTLYKTDETGKAEDAIAVARDAFPRLVLSPGTYRARIEHGLATIERAIVLGAGREVREDVILHVGKLRLDARSASDDSQLESVVFTITVDDPAAQGGTREVARSAARNPVFTLPAGLYHVHVRLGAAEGRGDATVRAGLETSASVIVSAARLKLASRRMGSEEVLTQRVRYRIEQLDETGSSGVEIVSTSNPRPVFDLPAGRYLITGRLGGANAEERIEVDLKEGRAEEIAIEHAAGELSLSLHEASGGLVRSVFWEIQDQDGQSVWSSVEIEPKVALKPGDYRLNWLAGARTGSQAVTLAPGEARTVEISTE